MPTALVAVGSGSLRDTCKYATFKDGRRYATFATAASMNGYAASTASVTLRNGYKTSLAAHAPRGIFFDLKVSAEAPTWLSAAGLGDSLCRSTAQVDWWASHRLFGTYYSTVPYVLQGREEQRMLDHAGGLAHHDLAANGILQRLHDALRSRRVLHRHLASWLDGRTSDLALGRHVRRPRATRAPRMASRSASHRWLWRASRNGYFPSEEPPKVAPTRLALADSRGPLRPRARGIVLRGSA